MKFQHDFTLLSATPHCREYGCDGVTMRLDFFDHILRVALLRRDVAPVPTWSVCPGEADCPREGRDKLSTEGFTLAAPAVTETNSNLSFTLDGVDFTVEKRNFRITGRTARGILYQDRDGLAYNFEGELGRGTLHYTRREEGERIFGLGESSVEGKLHDYMESLENPTLAPYAGTAEVRLRATAMAPDEASAEAMLEPVIQKVREELGDLVYAVDEPKLESVCLRLLKEKGLTFAAAASCTGGLIAKRFTDQSGASSAFMGGVVCYTNYVKHHVLGVPQEILDEFGAVSAQTAAAMAEGARRVCGSDIAVSVTGCAGPNSDERGTPVGTGFVGFASPESTIVKPIQMGKDREWARVYAASFAFDLIRRYLTDCLN